MASAQLFLRQSPSGEIDPLSLHNKIKMIKNHETFKMSESDFYMIEFQDANGKTRTFYSEKALGFNKPKDNLVEEMHSGKVSWYRDYKPNSNGGAVAAGAVAGGLLGAAIMAGATSGSDGIKDYFVKDDHPDYGTSYKDLLVMTNDRADLKNRIENIRNAYDLGSILQDYDIGEEATIDRLKKSSLTYRIKALEQIEELDTISIKYPNDLKVGNNVLYKGRSGDVFAVANEDGSGNFVEIKYASSDGQTRKAVVPLKDLRIIKNEID